jgi:hypothetical protein
MGCYTNPNSFLSSPTVSRERVDVAVWRIKRDGSGAARETTRQWATFTWGWERLRGAISPVMVVKVAPFIPLGLGFWAKYLGLGFWFILYFFCLILARTKSSFFFFF